MFVLNPGGKGGAGIGGNSSGFQQNLWFWGKLGLYFVGIRLAFVYMSGAGSIQDGGSSSGNSSSSSSSSK